MSAQRDQSNSDREQLVAAVQEAWDLSREAARLIDERDSALDRITELVGGDRLAAFHNAHQRIGELTTGRSRS